MFHMETVLVKKFPTVEKALSDSMLVGGIVFKASISKSKFFVRFTEASKAIMSLAILL